jgi:glycosyltransferase involved in cell wall biosynthesis
MIIFHLIVGLETGGAEMMLSRLVTGLTNHQHVVVTMTGLGKLGERLVQAGHRVENLNFKQSGLLIGIWRLWRLLRNARPDVLQTWMYHSDLIGGIVGRLAGVPRIVWNVRNTKIPQRGWSSTLLIIKLCSLVSYFVPHRIICCAHAGRRLHESLGYCRSRLVVIPNGYPIDNLTKEIDDRDAGRRLLSVPEGSFVIGIVGRYDYLKGYDIFIKAAALAQSKSSRPLVFMMIGRGVGPANQDLETLIKGQPVGIDCRLMEEQDHVQRFMALFDVLCLASRAEGFPNVVAEAMLAGTPCVATDVGDAAHIIGDTGFVVPPEDPQALAMAFLHAQRTSSAVLRAMGLRARLRIHTNFSLESVTKMYECVYVGREDT